MGQRGQPGLLEGPSCGSGGSGHRMVSGGGFTGEGDLRVKLVRFRSGTRIS